MAYHVHCVALKTRTREPCTMVSKTNLRPLYFLLLILSLTAWSLGGCAETGVHEFDTHESTGTLDNLAEPETNPNESTDETTDGDDSESGDIDGNGEDSSASNGGIMRGGRCEGNYLLTLASELAMIANCTENNSCFGG